MPHDLSPTVVQLIEEHMVTGLYSSEDELLREALAEEQGDLAAIQEAIAAMEAGDEGIPLDDAIAEIRRRHGLDATP